MTNTRERILIVEDDSAARIGLQQLVRGWGFDVETAADGEEGLERGLRTRPSLVVLDVKLPIRDGISVADALRAHDRRRPPIVLITGTDRPEEQAQRVGAIGYLRKPFELDDLVSLVWRGV
ncbi:MAG TPA: response regulator, partial [Vicinamibacterales bacterium]|nr:response regulator [Vicinamibacterales bacterium]